MNRKQYKEYEGVVTPAIKEFGFEFESIIVGKNHAKIIMRHLDSGESRFAICGTTPSCNRAIKNVVRSCRKECHSFLQGVAQCA